MSTSHRDIGVGCVACDGQTRRHDWTAMVANSTGDATPVSTAAPSSTPSVTPTRTADGHIDRDPADDRAGSGDGDVHAHRHGERIEHACAYADADQDAAPQWRLESPHRRLDACNPC